MDSDHYETVDLNAVGKLVLKVLEAKDTLAMDITGTSDPYCKVSFENQQYRTKIIDRTLSPVWNEEFIFNVRSTSSKLQIEVWDYDMASSDDFMGYFEINLMDVVNQGGLVETWYDLDAHPSKQEKEAKKKKKKNRGKIHLSLRLFQYHGMTKYLFENNLSCAMAIIHHTPKDQTADALAHVFYAAGTKPLVDLVSFTVLEEVNKTVQPETLLRGDSMATKLMKASSKLAGKFFVPSVLSTLIKNVLENPGHVEVDPSKLPPGDDITANQEALRASCQRFLESLLSSFSTAPILIQQIAGWLGGIVQTKFPDQVVQALGGYLFLRLFCPAISTPEMYGICKEPPSPEARRHLLLVAKVLQTLANGVLFGQKESYMVYLNSFIQTHQQVFANQVWAFASGQLTTGQHLTTAPVAFTQLVHDLDYLIKIMNDSFPQVVQPCLLDPNVAVSLKSILHDFSGIIDHQKNLDAIRGPKDSTPGEKKGLRDSAPGAKVHRASVSTATK